MDRAEYEKILTDAIAGEIEAQEFYRDVAERMTDDHLKQLFERFVAEETKHQRILEGFRDKMPESLPFDESRDYGVAETVDEPPLSTNMTPADAFALAMRKEAAAMARYSALADGCTDADQKRIFQELAAMERDHKRRMETAFVDIGYPEVW